MLLRNGARFPRLVAHRGGGWHVPENTIEGLRCAAQHKFQAVEFDVKLTQCNTPILMHDSTLKRTTNGHGLVARRDYASLKLLSAGMGKAEFAHLRIPTFEEAAAECNALGLYANVEIKPCKGREVETGIAVARATRALWKNSSTPPLLSSFSVEALRAAQKEAPEIPRALLTSFFIGGWQALAKELDVDAINVNARYPGWSGIQKMTRAGYHVMYYTVNSADRINELLREVSGVFTDALAEVSGKGLTATPPAVRDAAFSARFAK